MRDVLGTIAADQDAIIRAGSRGALVVDGGPGTGKTVVALHRAAYLLHADPRLSPAAAGALRRPHRAYLAYVADVLPSLGEEGSRPARCATCYPRGPRPCRRWTRRSPGSKATAAMVAAVEPAVALYEEPHARGSGRDPVGRPVVAPEDWAEAFAAVDPGTPHNEARDEVWEALATLLVDRCDADVPPEQLRRALTQDEALVDAFGGAWPRLDAAELVGDLWSVPAYPAPLCSWLAPDEVRRLQRADPQAWTTSDLPMLDAARQRLGDPDTSRRRRREEAGWPPSARRWRVVDHLVATDDSEMMVMSMLPGRTLGAALVADAQVGDPTCSPALRPRRRRRGQELTDAEWQMLLLRCPSRSVTVVGDRAQARHGFAESWRERLQRVGFDEVREATLSVNYRTPEEVMVEAER